jgi:hypothetical protein
MRNTLSIFLSAITIISFNIPKNAITQVHNDECKGDILAKMSKNSEYIYSSSGAVFEVLGQDFIDSQKWKKGDIISICKNPQHDVFQISNLNRNEILVVTLKKEK